MTEEQRRKAEEKVRVHVAFGEKRTGQDWAKKIGIPFGEFFYYVAADNLTVEEIYTKLGIVYRKTKRGPAGKHLPITRDTIEWLLMFSGYVEELGGLEIKVQQGRPVHRIFLDGHKFGDFYYKENRLVLTSGEGLYLSDFDPEDVEVVRRGGIWHWHASTRRRLFEKLGISAP